MKAIILAGGRATRLPDSAREIPKILVDIGGKPVLQHQIDLLAQHGINDVRFSLGVKADQVIEYLKGKHDHITQNKPLGTGGAIKLAVHDVTDPFVVLNGDILSDINFSEFLDIYKQSGAEHMLAAWHCSDVRDFGHVGLDWERSPSEKHAPVNDFFEKPAKKVAGFINTGAYIMRPEPFLEHPEDSFSVERDIFPRLVDEGKLHAYVHGGLWVEMGTEERLHQVRKEFKNYSS